MITAPILPGFYSSGILSSPEWRKGGKPSFTRVHEGGDERGTFARDGLAKARANVAGKATPGAAAGGDCKANFILGGYKVTFFEDAEKRGKEKRELENRLRMVAENHFPVMAIQPQKPEFIQAVHQRCQSWLCEHCKKGKAEELRKSLLSVVEIAFANPKLFTFTTAREFYASPEEAYKTITKQKYIARAMKGMGIHRWFAVLEFQEEEGQGWPHWHVMIDLSDLPGLWYNKENQRYLKTMPKTIAGWLFIPHCVNLVRLNRLLKKWRFGLCQLSKQNKRVTTPEHAINYMMKYLSVMPDRHYSQWVYNLPRIRMFSRSWELAKIMRKPNAKASVKNPHPEPRAKARPPVERIAECRYKIIMVNRDNPQEKPGKPILFDREWMGLAAVLGAVQVERYDKRRKRFYTVWGFKDRAALQKFRSVMLYTPPKNIMPYGKEPMHQWHVKQKMEARRQELLAWWDDHPPEKSVRQVGFQKSA